MSESESCGCCRGNRIAAKQGEFTQEAVRVACRESIREAIDVQLAGDQLSPVVIDGLPTIGKTHQIPEVASELDEPVALLTHRYETRDDLLRLIDQFNAHAVEIPTLDRHCPTRRKKYGKTWAERVADYRSRGASPTYLHWHLNEIPCMDDGKCPYLTRWESVEDAKIIVGGPVHAGLKRAIKNRVVIFDEDPGDAFRRTFDATELASAISAFLSDNDEIPISTYHELLMVANNDGFADQQATIREEIADTESLAQQTEAIGEDGGHVEAPTAVYALLELDGPTIGEDQGAGNWDDNLRKEVGLDFTALPDGAQVVCDHAESQLVIRRPPNLEKAKAVVGLDGTPVEVLWQGRLGAEDIECWRVLCDDCRARYLKDVIGYRFVQTESAIKPYSSGRHINARSDYGLIEAVASRHEEAPGVITTKQARQQLFEDHASEKVVDPGRVTDLVSGIKHYGALRSSNDFTGRAVGIVIGSRHPGDRPIQLTAALEGHTAIRDEDKRGVDLEYGIPGTPFLKHYREHEVAQAVLRFGRNTASTVYIHTAALPDWLADIVDVGPDDVEIELRSEGKQSVMCSLLDDGPGTAGEIADRDSVSIEEKHTRDCLKELYDKGVVSRDDTQPYTWSDHFLAESPLTARVDLPNPAELDQG